MSQHLIANKDNNDTIITFIINKSIESFREDIASFEEVKRVCDLNVAMQYYVQRLIHLMEEQGIISAGYFNQNDYDMIAQRLIDTIQI
jgi:hypothetical protein